MSDTVSVSPAMPQSAHVVIRRIALIALLAVVLGFGIQLLMLAAKLSFGMPVTAAGVALDMTQGIAWSLLVCTGIGLIMTIARTRPLLAGALSMIAAPIAIALAKGSQKVMSGLLSAAEQQAVLSLSTISVLKAIEYGVLGWLLARLVQRSEERALPYLGSGAAVGVVLGGAIAFLGYQVALGMGPAPVGRLVVSLVNEVLFPVGCAGVIYCGQLVGRSMRVSEPMQA